MSDGIYQEKDNMNKYNALIIGCGSIGAIKPSKFDSPKTKSILTHAHAYYSHPQIDNIGFIDIDDNKAKKAAKKWNKNNSTFMMEIKNNFDIISICTPTENHYESLLSALEMNPKIVIAEKPFCKNIEEAKIISDIYKEKNIPIIVGYIRRYNKIHESIKDIINIDEIGTIYSCTLYYDRGFKRDGSHFIDLCNYWFGNFEKGQLLPSSPIYDYSHNDPTFAVHLSYEKCKNIFMIPSDGNKFSIFEIDIIGSRKRLKFINNGNKLIRFDIKNEEIYGNYSAMSNEGVSFETDLNQSLLSLVQNAIDVIENKADLICSSYDAIKVHEIFKLLGV